MSSIGIFLSLQISRLIRRTVAGRQAADYVRLVSYEKSNM